MATLLANISATSYGIIDEKLRKQFAKILKSNHNALSNQKRYKGLMVELPNLLLTPFTLY